ncbi:MAG: hypothetical protein LAO09_15640 [Acidobacteriia bacterium]|nr:hypothetical protein [Terriglobia bacterium]
MKPISWRTQLRLVGGSYVFVLLVSAGLVLQRYLQYVRHPDDAAASGGMWAFGDWLLELFIGGLFLVPTFFLLLVISKSEPVYTRYAKVLFGFSLTAPLSLAILSIPAAREGWLLGAPCLYRPLASPVVLVVEGGSRLMARFPLPKKLTSYALLIELATLVLIVALLFFAARAHRG